MTEPLAILNALRFDSETGTGLFENADIVTASIIPSPLPCDELILIARYRHVMSARDHSPPRTRPRMKYRSNSANAAPTVLGSMS